MVFPVNNYLLANKTEEIGAYPDGLSMGELALLLEDCDTRESRFRPSSGHCRRLGPGGEGK